MLWALLVAAAAISWMVSASHCPAPRLPPAEFTTLTCIPGVIHYNDAKIQLLDLPGIIEGAAEGRGENWGRMLLDGSC